MKRLAPFLLLVLVACGPAPAPAPYPGPPAAVSFAVAATFGQYGPEVQAKALRVAKCESGWVATAGAGSYYQGLFQLGRHISAIYVYGGDFLDPYQNAAAARDLWLSRGNWSAWPVCGQR